MSEIDSLPSNVGGRRKSWMETGLNGVVDVFSSGHVSVYSEAKSTVVGSREQRPSQ